MTGAVGTFFVEEVQDRPGGRLDMADRVGQINATLSGIAPTLRWRVDGLPWFVLGFDVVDGRSADFTRGEDDDLSRMVEMIDQIATVDPRNQRGERETCETGSPFPTPDQ